MKSSGKGNRPYNIFSGPISAVSRSVPMLRCEFVDELGKRCDKYHHVKPWHLGNHRKYCPKHREYYAEIEANEIIKKHPQYAKYL